MSFHTRMNKILESYMLTPEQIREFMTKLGFVETSLAGETVWIANLSVSIRVNTTKGFNTLPCLKKEIYKRVSYHRTEFLNALDSIMLFSLSDMETFDASYTKEDLAKRNKRGQETIKPILNNPIRDQKRKPRYTNVLDL